MRMETFIRKGLRLKAHRVVEVQEDRAAAELVIRLDRREHRRLRYGERGWPGMGIAFARRPEGRWRDLALRDAGVRPLSRALSSLRAARRTRPVGRQVATRNARLGPRGRGW